MLFILFLINVVFGADCNDRTAYYNNAKLNNKDYYYYDDRTHFSSSLEKYDRAAYRNMIKSKISCTGKWCINNEWKCSENNDCYHVEHIIPTANNIKEIGGCSADILGNLIMSYGSWNVALSNSYYGEKVKIYGEKIVREAYQSVYRACHGKQAEYYPDELCLPPNNISNYIPFLIGLFIALIVIMVFGIIYNKYQNNNDIELNNY